MDLKEAGEFLCRHWGKIFLLSFLGVAAAAAYYFGTQPLYVSQAKLMIRYVLERSMADQVPDGTLRVGQTGDSLLRSEREILTSWDLAEKVALLPGMKDLAPKSEGAVPPAAAAAVIASNLSVNAVNGSNIIVVTFKHIDRELVSRALSNLIQQYFVKHLEIHRPKEASKFYAAKLEISRTKLKSAEAELSKLKADAGILSPEGAMTALQGQRAKIESDQIATNIRLAGQRAQVATLERLLGEEKNRARPTEKVDVKPAAPGEEWTHQLRIELLTGRARLAVIEAESEELKATLATTQKEVSTMNGLLPKFAEKEQARDIEEANYKIMAANLDTMMIDGALDPSKIPNISIVQEPTPAVMDVSQRDKLALGIVCGSPFVAIACVLVFSLVFGTARKRDAAGKEESPATASS